MAKVHTMDEGTGRDRRGFALLMLAALGCNPSPRRARVAAEDIIMCRQKCQEKFDDDGTPKPGVAPAIEAWKRGDPDASDRLWAEVYAVEGTCDRKCDAMQIGEVREEASP